MFFMYDSLRYSAIRDATARGPRRRRTAPHDKI